MGSSLSTKPITGFPEYLPAECLQLHRFIDSIRSSFERYGFSPIETPSVERDETLKSKGEIDKQIYSLFRPNVPEDVEKETGLSLHFDLTVPLARYVGQHGGKLAFPFRRYQIQKVWRGERPQKGRFREFYQCDIDIVGDGSLDLLADAEIPQVINDVFSKLEIGNFTIRMSNRKVLNGFLDHFGVTGEQAEETLRALDRLPKLKGGWDELGGFLTKELSLDPATVEALRALVNTSGPTEGFLERLGNIVIENERYQQGLEELEEVFGHLRRLGVPENRFEVDFSITRGLDYYTGTIYETFLEGHEETLGSICSGGRYDNLASNFVSKEFPGVGIAIGLSRLFHALIETGAIPSSRQTPADVLVTVPDRSRLGDSVDIADQLRRSGLNVELFVQNSKHDKQIRSALKKGIPIAVIPWPDKIEEMDSVEVRDLVNGDREVVIRHEVASVVRFVLEKWAISHPG